MKKIDLIIFDLDGTLVDSRKDIVNAVNFALKSLGKSEKSFSKIVSFIGTGVRDLLVKSFDSEDTALLGKANSIFEKYYMKHSSDETAIYPNVKDVLKTLKHKEMIVVTNRRKDMAKATLNIFGINKYFKDVIGGDDIHCLKPKACPINKGLELVNINKKHSIMVGDMDLDVMAGKNAGILTCAVTYGIGKKEDIIKARPDYMINDIKELESIIS